MGLASKLAAAQANAPAYPGGPPVAGGQQPQGQGGYPPQPGQQQQYQAYPGGGRNQASSQMASGTPSALRPGQGGPAQTQNTQQPTRTDTMYSVGTSQSAYGAPSIPPRPNQTPQPPPTDQYGRPMSPYAPHQQQGTPTSPYPHQQPPHRQPTSPYPPQPQSPYPGSPHPQQLSQNPPYGAPRPGYPQQPPQQTYNAYQPPPHPQYQHQPPYQQGPQFGQQQPFSTQGPGYGPPHGQYPPQGQPGQPPYQGGAPQQQGGYGGPPPQPPQNVKAYKDLLTRCIAEKALQNFYPPNHPVLDQIAARAAQQVAKLATDWKIHPEIAADIVKLALYDVILYVDDSGSMAFEENGSRIDDLKLILNRVAYATGLFDDDGIQVRFMNSQDQGNGIKNEHMVNEMISRTKFSGLTPMGREMQNKVLGPLVLNPARGGQLRKPVLVITITDGQPTGESPNDIANIIKNAVSELARNPRYGKGGLAFQFAQVGNDLKAREFLSNLDEDKSIGDVIDCTSNFEVEQDEMKRANPPVDLTPDMWLIKLLLGSIDSSYDTKDEKSSGAAQGNFPPPGQYGGGGYPPPQQQGGYPPQGGYPGGGPQQGQYPPQGGYPPQGYGAPPPPRY